VALPAVQRPQHLKAALETETLPVGSAFQKCQIQSALDLQASVHPLLFYSKTTRGVPEQAWRCRQLKSGAPAT
jgi:hypothetical protein